jgi:hypothetical protein
MGKLHRLGNIKRAAKPHHNSMFFDRAELDLLLSLYSRRVMSGEWRDYAIDQQAGMAVFSVYRHSHERPLYTIAKRAGAAGREQEYLVCRGPEKLVCSRHLPEVLTVFSPPLQVVS